MDNFFYNDILNLNKEYAIEKMCVEDAQTMHNLHFHDYYEIYYLEKGSRTYFIKNNSYKMIVGSVAIIPPYTLHRTMGPSGSYYGRILLQFYSSIFLLDSIKDKFDTILGSVRFKGDSQLLVTNLFNKILEIETTNIDLKNELAKIKINELLVTLINADFSEAISVNNNISRIVDYIDNNFSEKITLDFLSKKFNISKWYLSRTFKKNTMFNIITYINYVRVVNARILLKDTKTSITEICDMVGFENLTHFERIFKRFFGISAKEYRRQYVSSYKK